VDASAPIQDLLTTFRTPQKALGGGKGAAREVRKEDRVDPL